MRWIQLIQVHIWGFGKSWYCQRKSLMAKIFIFISVILLIFASLITTFTRSYLLRRQIVTSSQCLFIKHVIYMYCNLSKDVKESFQAIKNFQRSFMNILKSVTYSYVSKLHFTSSTCISNYARIMVDEDYCKDCEC